VKWDTGVVGSGQRGALGIRGTQESPRRLCVSRPGVELEGAPGPHGARLDEEKLVRAPDPLHEFVDIYADREALLKRPWGV
jgi:hypothetical protein